MKILYTKAFSKDLEKLRDKKAAEDIEEAIKNIKSAGDKRFILN